MTVSLRTREWAFLAFLVVVSAVCIRLGVWQIARHKERTAENIRIRRNLEADPLTRLEWLEEPESYAFRRVTARGTYDPAHEVLLKNRSRGGVPGYHLVTPMRLLDADATVLVDRGWIPADAAAHLERFEAGGIADITGTIRRAQSEPAFGFLRDPIPSPGSPPLKEWRVLNVEGIQQQTPYTLLPVYIALESPAGEPPPFPDAGLDLSLGPHLGYAFQWFAFAGVALIGGGIWLRRKMRNESNLSRRS
jgi:surfeit locus 1 family protein